MNDQEIEETEFYDNQENDLGNSKKSCISLIILSITTYVLIIFLLWQITPLIRTIQKKSFAIQNNINLNSQNLLNSTRDNLYESFDKKKQVIEKQSQNIINTKKDDILNQSQESLKETINQQLNDINKN